MSVCRVKSFILIQCRQCNKRGEEKHSFAKIIHRTFFWGIEINKLSKSRIRKHVEKVNVIQSAQHHSMNLSTLKLNLLHTTHTRTHCAHGCRPRLLTIRLYHILLLLLFLRLKAFHCVTMLVQWHFHRIQFIVYALVGALGFFPRTQWTAT